MGKHFPFIIILVVVLLARLGVFLYYQPWSSRYDLRMVGEDPYTYHRLAMDLLVKRTYGNREWDPQYHAATVRPPGYPLFIAAVYALFGAKPWVVLLAQILLEIAGCALLMVLMRGLSGASSALIAGLLYGLHPYTVFTSITMYSETLFLSLSVLFLYLVFAFTRTDAAVRKAVLIAVATGVLGGVLTYVRVSMLYFIPLLFLVICLTMNAAMTRRVVLVLVFAIAFTAILTPWMLHNKSKFGSYRLSVSGEYNLLVLTVGVAFMQGSGVEEYSVTKSRLATTAREKMQADGLDPAEHPLELAKYYRKTAGELVMEEPRTVILGVARGLLKFWLLPSRASGEPLNTRGLIGRLTFFVSLMIQIVLLTGAVYGAKLLWGPETRRWVWMFCIASVYFSLTAGAAGSSRFFLQVLPYTVVLSGAGWSAWLSRWHRKSQESMG